MPKLVARIHTFRAEVDCEVSYASFIFSSCRVGTAKTIQDSGGFITSRGGWPETRNSGFTTSNHVQDFVTPDLC